MLFKAKFELDNMVNPKSYQQAMKSEDRLKWKEAIFEEFDSLENNHVFEIVKKEELKEKP